MLWFHLKKFKLFISLSIFLIAFNYVTSQQLLIDSLTQRRTRFEQSQNFIKTDTNYIKTLYILSRSYVYLNKDSTNSLAIKALKLSESIGFKKGIAGSKLALGLAQIFEGSFDEGFKNTEHAKEISQEINADTIYLKSLNAIGMGHFMKTDYPKGYMLCQIGRKKAEELNNHEMSVMFNMNLATSFAILNDATQALPYYEKCLQLLKNKDDDIALAQVKSNMGYLFLKTKENRKAKIYLKDRQYISAQEYATMKSLKKISIFLGKPLQK
jgi:tetratricopeptide (TPR) repeat protein